MIKNKIKATWDLLKNWKTIRKRYDQIQKSRTVSDREIIKSFKNEISVPKAVATEYSNNMFNNFISTLSKIARKFI